MKKPVRKHGKTNTDKINNSPKLGLFKTSTVANKSGAAFNRDGSIMRQAEALGSKSDVAGSVRAKYGVDKKEPIYAYGFAGKLADSVAQKRASTPAKKKKK